MKKPKESAKELTDEQVLKEFVRRFKCDAAVLIYLEDGSEFGFSRWVNKTGKHWANSVFQAVREKVFLTDEKAPDEGGVTTKL